jgi:hypothetical protein
MHDDLENLKIYINENNFTLKGAIHIGKYLNDVHSFYNLMNIHDNNIIWIHSENSKSANNMKIFSTTIDGLNTQDQFTNEQICYLECCIDTPKLLISDININKSQTLSNFMIDNNFDPSEYNLWYFDCCGTELQILKEAKNYLKYVDIIYTGVCSTNINNSTDLLPEIDNLLFLHKFKRVNIIQKDMFWHSAIYIRL